MQFHQLYLIASAASSLAQNTPFFVERNAAIHQRDRRQASNLTWPHQTFITEPNYLPPIPKINKNKPTAPGHLFFAQQGPNCPQQTAMIMSEDGELIWQSDPQTPFPAVNFSPQTFHGKPVLVYNMAVGAPIVDTGAVTYTNVQILDDTYTLLHTVSVLDPTFTAAGGNWSSYIDSHEAYITSRNTLLVPAYNITPWDLSPVNGPEDGWLLESVVYEVSIPEGDILYTWRSSDHIPITDTFVPLDAVYGYGNTSVHAWDYFHLNSIQEWGDDGLVLSARNTWDILFINKTTDAVEWRLRGNDGGDFALDEEGRFSWQHDARLRLHDNELLLSMFDNRNSLAPPFVPSEGHLLTLDLAAKTANIKTVYVDGGDAVVSQFAGSMQLELEDESPYVLVGHGSQPVTEEYDLDGTLRMSWRFGPRDPPYPGIANYRAFKSLWKGYPATSPKVKACKTVEGTDIFVSWNGATEVTGWSVYTGEHEYSMVKSTSVPKTGFETKISIAETVAMVKVQAEGREADDDRFNAKSSVAVASQNC